MGAVIVGLGVSVALSSGVGIVWDLVSPSPRIPSGGGLACLVAAFVTIAVGLPLFVYGARHSRETMSQREALLAVTLIWVGAGIFGGLPYVLGARIDPSGAFFEAVSGFTTTGATVITDIETRLSRPLLLWRSMTQWLGGMGIVVLFVAVMPSLGAGGKHLYKGEAPGAQAEGFRPRIAETSIALWRLYAVFTVVEAVLLVLCGMDVFEAICHAMTTMSTGGFSTRDASIAAFGVPAFEWVMSAFMLIGSLNFGVYYLALRGRRISTLLRDLEFRVFVAITAGAVLSLAAMNYPLHPDPVDSIRYALFIVASTISTTGYVTDNYAIYPPGALVILLFLMIVGGCSGSTAGGIKVERIVIIAKQTIAQMRREFDPSVVRVVRMGRAFVAKTIVAEVLTFFAAYLACIAAGVLVIAVIERVPVEAVFGAMVTCVGNNGPSPFYDHVEGFGDNFAGYSSISKVIFAIAMLLGRLELFTMFALLIPGFWRR